MFGGTIKQSGWGCSCNQGKCLFLLGWGQVLAPFCKRRKMPFKARRVSVSLLKGFEICGCEGGEQPNPLLDLQKRFNITLQHQQGILLLPQSSPCPLIPCWQEPCRALEQSWSEEALASPTNKAQPLLFPWDHPGPTQLYTEGRGEEKKGWLE